MKQMTEDFKEALSSSPRIVNDENNDDNEMMTVSTLSNTFHNIIQQSSNTLLNSKFRLPFYFESDCMNLPVIESLEDFGWISEFHDDPPSGILNFGFHDDLRSSVNPFFS
jgi:hypothetical protein